MCPGLGLRRRDDRSRTCQGLAAGPAQTITGTLHDGATYLIQVPANWNGTLVLYSHGYVTPGSPNPATDVGDPLTGAVAAEQRLRARRVVLRHNRLGAAAGDSRSTLDPERLRPARRHAVSNHRVGALARRDDHRRTAPGRAGPLHCGTPDVRRARGRRGHLERGARLRGRGAAASRADLRTAGGQHHRPHDQPRHRRDVARRRPRPPPQGRARIALASALGDLPGWFDPASPEPAATDYVTQEANQFLWQTQVDGPFAFALRAELEARAGGNVSWTTGVNFTAQLALSSDYAEVQALYSAAGLSLSADLATLQASAPIAARSGRGQVPDQVHRLQRRPRPSGAHAPHHR